MNIAISDIDHVNLNEENIIFSQANMSYTVHQCKTKQDVINNLKDANIILNQYAPFDRDVFKSLPNLKQIVRYGVGVDNIDCIAASEFGVQICNIPDYGMNEVADQAVALLLSLIRKTVIMSNHTKSKKWDYSRAVPIYRITQKTVGIVGLGRIGRTFLKRIRGFDCNIIAYDPKYNEGSTIDGVKIVSFETLLKSSDMISIHCPLQSNTYNLFNLKTMKKMKKTSFLVNTARGGIVNEDDLYTALSKNIIAGAALDVVLKEPLETTNKLCSLENFICSPHIAWYSEESSCELKRKVAQEAVRFAKGEKLHYPVNKI